MNWRYLKRGLVGLCLTAIASCQSANVPESDLDPLVSSEASLANGERIFWAGGCASCHTSQKIAENTPTDLGGGRVINTPFGEFYPSNISPDFETGIGAWSLPDFDRALRKGVAPNGRSYYPAFPFTSYARMSASDVSDLFGFLATLPAHSNTIQDNKLMFPAKLPLASNIWRQMYLRPAPVRSKANTTLEEIRGQYLVEGPGHCGSCHTPRNPLGAQRHGLWLAGAYTLDNEGFAPNLTPHADGLKDWSTADIVDSLRAKPSEDHANFGMNSVRENLSHLPESDLFAIAAYLKSIPPKASIASN